MFLNASLLSQSMYLVSFVFLIIKEDDLCFRLALNSMTLTRYAQVLSPLSP